MIRKYVLLQLLFIILIPTMTNAQDQKAPEAIALHLAEEQLIAYNNRDIEAFLKPYSEDVKVYGYPNTLLYEGKAKMRAAYTDWFKNTTDLHCKLVSRMVLGNTVIDQEEVTVDKNKPKFNAIAVYTITNDKITEVRFIR